MEQDNKNKKIPKHICIIPDGSRRWAKQKGLASVAGHKQGVDNFEGLVNTALELDIHYMTLWAFSTENWKRSKEENDYLFDLIRNYYDKFKNIVREKNTRFIHLGRRDRLPQDIVKLFSDLEQETKDFTNTVISIAIDYGGHDELIRAFKKIQEQNLEITPENIEKCLDTHLLPPPDLIIRTSGEQRLSGFMSWQSEYAEYAFPKVFFPDFTPEEFKKVIQEYSNRKRRFGGD